MKRIFIVFLALILVVPLFAQNNDGNHSINSISKGFAGRIDFGYRYPAELDDLPDKIRNQFILDFVGSYQFHPRYSAGLGTGMHIGSELHIPFFAEFKGLFSDKSIAPYSSLAIGYTTEINDVAGGYTWDGFGFLLNPNMGLLIRMPDKTAISLEIGYELQRCTDYVYWGNYSSRNNHAIDFTLGFAFASGFNYKYFVEYEREKISLKPFRFYAMYSRSTTWSGENGLTLALGRKWGGYVSGAYGEYGSEDIYGLKFFTGGAFRRVAPIMSIYAGGGFIGKGYAAVSPYTHFNWRNYYGLETGVLLNVKFLAFSAGFGSGLFTKCMPADGQLCIYHQMPEDHYFLDIGSQLFLKLGIGINF